MKLLQVEDFFVLYHCLLVLKPYALKFFFIYLSQKIYLCVYVWFIPRTSSIPFLNGICFVLCIFVHFTTRLGEKNDKTGLNARLVGGVPGDFEFSEISAVPMSDRCSIVPILDEAKTFLKHKSFEVIRNQKLRTFEAPKIAEVSKLRIFAESRKLRSTPPYAATKKAAGFLSRP